MLANGVHCRESGGTGPVVLKVVPVTGAAILQVAHYWYEVGMLIEGGYSKSKDQPVKVANPARGQLNRGK